MRSESVRRESALHTGHSYCSEKRKKLAVVYVQRTMLFAAKNGDGVVRVLLFVAFWIRLEEKSKLSCSEFDAISS